MIYQELCNKITILPNRNTFTVVGQIRVCFHLRCDMKLPNCCRDAPHKLQVVDRTFFYIVYI